MTTYPSSRAVWVEDLIRRRLRVLSGDRSGAAMVEFALAAPILVLILVGVLEMALVGFVSIMMEASLREASRFGFTGQDPGGGSREAQILEIVRDNTLGLVTIEDSDVTVTSFPTFQSISGGEPFEDDNGNGEWDDGEAYTDFNGNGTRDGDAGTPGAGGGEDIVLYEIAVDWRMLTPLMGDIVGDSGILPLEASIAVRNEPFDAADLGIDE